MPMHEVVRSNLHIRLSAALRLSSIAGKGLPERMRTTAFAFLGLTAALGLALVAIFAQVSFPVLSPAPAPGGPLEVSAVSGAVALGHRPGTPALADSRRAVAEDVVDAHAGGSAGGSGGTRAAGGAVAGPVPAPQPSGEPGGGSSASPPAPEPEPSPVPAPDATPSPEPSPSSAAPPSSGSPPKTQPVPARPAEPEPEPATAPGNSGSSAAAEHASERGIEASSKPSAASATPAAVESPGNGNAYGHDK